MTNFVAEQNTRFAQFEEKISDFSKSFGERIEAQSGQLNPSNRAKSTNNNFTSDSQFSASLYMQKTFELAKAVKNVTENINKNQNNVIICGIKSESEESPENFKHEVHK